LKLIYFGGGSDVDIVEVLSNFPTVNILSNSRVKIHSEAEKLVLIKMPKKWFERKWERKGLVLK
jgi:hypothetical protein